MINYLPTENKDFTSSLEVSTKDDELPKGYQPKFRLTPPESRATPSEPVVDESAQETSENTSETETISQTKPPGAKPKDTDTKSKRYTDRKEFVKDLTDAYTKALKARGIDTAYAKMLVAQDALESGWGKYYRGNYNFGNITVPKGSDASYTLGKDHDANGNEITQKFRNYNSLDEWVGAKIDLLAGQRYQAFTRDASPAAFYDRIKRGGYAVDKEYVNKMLRVYNSPILARNGARIPSRFDTLVDKINFAKNGAKITKMQEGKQLPKDTRGNPVDATEVGYRQAYAESTFNPNAVSAAGAKGLFQIKDSALKDYLKAHPNEKIDLFDPGDNKKVRDWIIKRDITSDIFTKGQPSDSVM